MRCAAFDAVGLPWISKARVPVERAVQTGGIIAVNAEIKQPAYLDLIVTLEDADATTLIIPLYPVADHHYRRTFLLGGTAAKLEIEITPASAAAGVRRAWAERMGLRASCRNLFAAVWRHLATPHVLGLKMRQVLTGSASFVFRPEVSAATDEDVQYSRWQAAFETVQETAWIDGAVTSLIGDRRIRVLAVPTQDMTDQDLAATLSSLQKAARAEVFLPAKALRGENAVAAVRLEQPADVTAAAICHQNLVDAIGEVKPDLILPIQRSGLWSDESISALLIELSRNPRALAVYGDHDHIDAAGKRHGPVFKPAWGPDYFASSGYVGAPVAFKPDIAALEPREMRSSSTVTSSLLLSRLTAESSSADLVCHVPRILFHGCTERMDAPGTAEGTSAAVQNCPVERAGPTSVSPPALVSVIIPSKNNALFLERAARSVLDADYPHKELVIVDNGSRDEGHIALLRALSKEPNVKVATDPRPFNFSALINHGRTFCSGEILLLLNDDVESGDAGWLQELAAHAGRPEIGCVGALLLYPDRRVQHAGVVLGINGAPDHAFRFETIEDKPQSHPLRHVREVAAVTGACLAIRREVYDQVGGLDVDLPVTYNDVDLCLKVRQLGFRNLVTPFACLIHSESTSRGLDHSPAKQRRLMQELSRFRKLWGNNALYDPFYSPHLDRTSASFKARSL
ncbi:MAG: glycosyltransferase [Hyphomicrobium sp.]|jgi:GT2 family glycosyltransferase